MYYRYLKGINIFNKDILREICVYFLPSEPNMEVIPMLFSFITHLYNTGDTVTRDSEMWTSWPSLQFTSGFTYDEFISIKKIFDRIK